MSLQSIKLLPTFQSSDNTWLSWYKDVKSTLNRKDANRLFSMLWNNENGYDSDANTKFLRDEMEDYGVEIATSSLGEIKDFGIGVKNFVGDYFTAGKILGITMAGICVVAVGGLILQIAFKKDVRREAVQIGTLVGTRGLSGIGKK
jgi:predicted RNA-binding protein with EMAP domain